MWWHSRRNQISSFGEMDGLFKSAGASVQSTTGNRGLCISGSNAEYTIFRGSVKGTGYQLHSPVSSSLPLPCVTVYHHISAGLYFLFRLHSGTTQSSRTFWIKKIPSCSCLKQNVNLLIVLAFYSRPRADSEYQTQTKYLVLHIGTSVMNSCRFLRRRKGSDVSPNKYKMNCRLSP